MVTDLKAIRVELADAADCIREIKRQTRRVLVPTRRYGFRRVELRDDNGHPHNHYKWVPVERRETLRPGKNLTPDEGQALARSKREATLLCTILAARRGRFHSMAMFKSPELLEELAQAWRSYGPRNPVEPVTEVVAEVTIDDVEAAEQTAAVVAGVKVDS